MRLNIADPALGKLGRLLADEGHTVRLVGGAVRDMLLGLDPKDFDLASDATPEITMAVAERHGLRVIPTGLQHGTVTVVVDGVPFEITTLREDVETDGRHAEVRFVTDFRTDAARRDFTINAMSADLLTGEVHDHFGGIDDLHAGRVRFVGNASARIEEDYLRILRFFRFRTRFRADGAPEDGTTMDAVTSGAGGLRRISGERIWSEIGRILVHANGARELEVVRRVLVDREIGLELTHDRIARARALGRAGASAPVVLGVVAADALDALFERWKPSGDEMAAARLARDAWRDGSGDPHHWRCRVADGADASVLGPLLMARGDREAALAVASGVPTFPVRGRDIVDLGIPAGKRVGAEIARLRQAWKDAHFELGREDLLATVAPTEAPQP